MEQRQSRPSQAAQLPGVNTWTMRRWIRQGRVPACRSETGRLYIPAAWVDAQTGQGNDTSGRWCALYVRGSSSENKGALQAGGLKAYARARGYQVVHVVHEMASGMNDERPKLHRLLEQKDFDVLVVEHEDRLTRLGLRWFEALAPFRIEVVNAAEEATHDLMEDLVAVITSFVARLRALLRCCRDMAQVIAKQAKEMLRAARSNGLTREPRLHKWS